MSDKEIILPEVKPRYLMEVRTFVDHDGNELREHTAIVGVLPRGTPRFTGMGRVQINVNGVDQLFPVMYTIEAETISDAWAKAPDSFKAQSMGLAQKIADDLRKQSLAMPRNGFRHGRG